MDTERPHERYYQLQIKASCHLNCSYCPGLGLVASNQRNHQDLIQSLKKARFGGYNGALIPCNALEMESIPVTVETIKSFSLKPILQINTRQLHSKKQEIELALDCGVGIQLIHGNNTTLPESVLLNIIERAESFFITIVVHNRMHGLEAFRSLPDSLKKKAYFYFPYQIEKSDEFFQTESIYEFLKRFRTQFPGYRVNPSPGTELYDRRISENVDLDPLRKPSYSQRFSEETKALTYSVIIPAETESTHLFDTIESFTRQEMDLNDFEVVVVDTGLNPGFAKNAIEKIKSLSPSLNLKWVRTPVWSPNSKKPDHSVLAVAKNLGVKNASGEYLLFLNENSLITKNLLSDLVVEHNNWDLVQLQRHLLSHESESKDFKNMDGAALETTSEPENSFWDQFYKNNESWNQMPDGWRYISALNLSVRRDVFEYVGWFRKNFTSYTFDDTDFGYRAKRQGFNYKLSTNKVFQQPNEKDLSLLSRFSLEKQKPIAESAKIFFQNNLDPEIYEHLKSYM